MTIKMYAVEGMKCEGCVENVKRAIKRMPEVIEAQVHLSTPQAIVSMKEEILLEDLQQVISDAGSYQITEIEETEAGKLADEPQKKPGKVFGLFHHKKECCK